MLLNSDHFNKSCLKARFIKEKC